MLLLTRNSDLEHLIRKVVEPLACFFVCAPCGLVDLGEIGTQVVFDLLALDAEGVSPKGLEKLVSQVGTKVVVLIGLRPWVAAPKSWIQVVPREEALRAGLVRLLAGNPGSGR